MWNPNFALSPDPAGHEKRMQCHCGKEDATENTIDGGAVAGMESFDGDHSGRPRTVLFSSLLSVLRSPSRGDAKFAKAEPFSKLFGNQVD